MHKNKEATPVAPTMRTTFEPLGADARPSAAVQDSFPIEPEHFEWTSARLFRLLSVATVTFWGGFGILIVWMVIR